MAIILHNSIIVAVVIGRHHQGIPLAMRRMRKSIHSFPLLSYVIGKGLHLAALLELCY